MATDPERRSPEYGLLRLLPPRRKLLDLLETEDRLRKLAFSDYYRHIAIFGRQRHRSRDRSLITPWLAKTTISSGSKTAGIVRPHAGRKSATSR